MNRRHFAAGMAAMIPATAAGQDATPEPIGEGHDAEWLLSYYLSVVIGEERFDAIYDLFDPSVYDLDEYYWRHVERNAAIRRAGKQWTVVPVISCGNGPSAMVYATETTIDGDADIFYAVTVDGGRITWIRSIAD